MSKDSQIDNKKIAKNTFALYLRMIVIMAINFYMARVILDVLGVTDYGIYNLVGTIVVVFSFLKSSLSEATQRFLNYSMGQQKYDCLNKIFSTCLNCYFVLITIVLIIGELIWYLWGSSLNIPLERYSAATFAFHLSLVSFTIGILHVPYNAAIIAYEKMEVFAKISILEVVLKLLLTFSITYIICDKLELYALLMLLNTTMIFFTYYAYCRIKFPITKYVCIWNKTLIQEILSYTGWNMIGSLSGVLSESGVSLIFNHFCGVLLNASIGLSNQINNALSGFISGFQTAFKPQIVKLCAAKEIQEFHNLLCRSSKFSFFLFFLISMPIIINIRFLLSLWLVEVPRYVCTFSRIVLVGSLIDATSGVFYSSIGATGKIRQYQLSISLVFAMHAILTFILLYIGLDYRIVFFSRLFTRGGLNFGLGLYFLRKQTNLSIKKYVIDTLLPILKVSIIPVVCYVLYINYSDINNISAVIMNTILFELISIVLICKFGLLLAERNSIILFIKQKIR